ncbi:MAG: transketolase [Clostridia bacterium]|nr:transketolase [Clostridia bacterium]
MNSEQLAWLIRRHGVEMTHISHGSHIGAILSVADIVAVLYNDVANISPENMKDENRDRIILSKGHAGAAIYAALAEKGFFDRAELKTHYADGSRLSGHVSHKGVPGVEFSTGSLGHGACVAAGMALNAKLDKKPYYTYAIVGDGECDEGSIWEMALFANQFKLNQFVVIVDHNKMQSLDFCENTLSLAPFAEKWKAFGWNVLDIDGHNHDELRAAFAKAKESADKPTVIIANTVKGKGVSFMEFDILWHYRFPHEGEEYDGALKELHAAMPTGVVDPYEGDVK